MNYDAILNIIKLLKTNSKTQLNSINENIKVLEQFEKRIKELKESDN